MVSTSSTDDGRRSTNDGRRSTDDGTRSTNDGATTETIDPITVDGEPAVGVDVNNRKNNAGLEIKQRAYLTLHEDLQVGIYLTYPASGDEVSVNDFQKVLDSWRWE